MHSQLPLFSYCLILLLTCKSKPSAFCYCGSMYLFCSFLVVAVLATAIILEQESLQPKSLSSCLQILIYWKTEKAGCIESYFPFSNFWTTTALKPKRNKFNSFQGHHQTLQTQVLLSKGNTLSWSRFFLKTCKTYTRQSLCKILQ